MIEILLQNIYVQSLIVGLILALICFQLSRQTKLNEPPLAYYRFPIIGHTWRFLTDCENLILECRQKYGEIFSLYIFGDLITIVGKESTHEILKNDDDFSFLEGIQSRLPLDHIFFQHSPTRSIKLLGEFLRENLKDLTSRLHHHITKTTRIYIGECVEQKVIRDLNDFLSNIISISVANIIVGDECYYHEDIIETFRSLFTSIVRMVYVPPILSFIHPWLHHQFLILPLRIGKNSYTKHRKIIDSRVRPVIEQRLKSKRELGNAWVAPTDMLQVFLDDPEITPDLDPNNVNYIYIVDAIGEIIFASVATTAKIAAYVLYDLAGRKEYWQELYQEAQEINKQCNGIFTSYDIDKMVKLDNFVKESLRLSNSILFLPHKCTSMPYYTFENGFQIPNGRTVVVNFMEITHDEKLQGRNPSEFNAYRHIGRNSPAGKVDRNYVTFGGGKHACPGRFLAVREIKIILNYIMLNYNIRTESGKVLPYTFAGPIIKDRKDGVIFEKRMDIN